MLFSCPPLNRCCGAGVPVAAVASAISGIVLLAMIVIVIIVLLMLRKRRYVEIPVAK